MAHLRGLANLDLALNSRHLGKWPEKIGRYILNFAAIELISYQYLNILEATREDFNKNLEKLLSGRIQRIRDPVQESATTPQFLKDEVESLWSEVSDLSQRATESVIIRFFSRGRSVIPQRTLPI